MRAQILAAALVFAAVPSTAAAQVVMRSEPAPARAFGLAHPCRSYCQAAGEIAPIRLPLGIRPVEAGIRNIALIVDAQCDLDVIATKRIIICKLNIMGLKMTAVAGVLIMFDNDFSIQVVHNSFSDSMSE